MLHGSRSVLALGFIAALATTSAAQFGPTVKLSNATLGARGVDAADLDGDGKLDMVVASYNDDRVSWFPGDGQGGFGQQHVICEGLDGAIRVIARDFDGDGDLDLAVASYFDDRLSTFLNMGTDAQGTHFGPRVVLTTFVDGVWDLDAADLNGDGLVDLMTASENDNRIAWFRNLGGGAFANIKVLVGASNGASGVTAGDLDGDGDLDVVAAAKSDQTVAWFENLGGNVFASEVILSSTNFGVRDVTTGDFDSDGDVDVAAVGNDIWLLDNQGGGVLAPASVISTLSGARIEPEDLDSDGDLDFLVLRAFSSSALAFENTGAGFGSTSGTLFQSWTVSDVATGDFDGDGDPDAVSVASQDDTPRYFENTGPGAGAFVQLIYQPDVILGNDGAIWVSAGDLDGDGDADLVVSSPFSDNVTWYEGLGGSFGPAQLIGDNEAGARRNLIADFTGDGKNDVVSLRTAQSRLTLYAGRGNGQFEPPKAITVQGNLYDVDSGDLDGDGDLDLIVARKFSDQVVWFENFGSGNFSNARLISNAMADPNVVHVTDLDGDGLEDVIAGATVVGGVVWYRNLGGGLFDAGTQIGAGIFGALTIDSGDLEGDGDVDLLVGAKNFGTVYLIKSSSPGVLLAPSVALTGTFNVTDLVLADLGGDGVLDVTVAYDFSTQVLTYQGLGDGTFALPEVVTQESGNTSSVAAADLDGDGDLDLAMTSSSLDTVMWSENLVALVDCNTNGVGDSVDIASGFSLDLDANGVPDECLAPALGADVVSLDGLTGGTQNLTLDAGPLHGGALYFVLGSLSGTSPGVDLGVGILPLNVDSYFNLILVAPGAPPLVGSVGSLAIDGTGAASLVVAAALGQTAIGLTVHHAFVTLGPLGVDFVSNAAPLTIE